jgi:hypothetical protein
MEPPIMETDFEQLLNRTVSPLHRPEVTIPRKPEGTAKSSLQPVDRYMDLMRSENPSFDKRQEFHDLTDIEMNVPIHPERNGCRFCEDDFRRFLPATGRETFVSCFRYPRDQKLSSTFSIAMLYETNLLLASKRTTLILEQVCL